MRKFLVTGGAGFIGSHIVERLLKCGHFVRVLDNFSSGREENLNFTYNLSPKTYGLIKGDIRSLDTCIKAAKGIDFILHQAALRSVPKSLVHPKDYNEVNINGTLNMLEASLKNKVKRFIFASSSSVYGDTNNFPEKEDFVPKPISPYALTKLAGEYYCKIFSYHYGLPCVSLRYFNVFGPRQSLDDEYAVVIPKFISCILRDEAPPVFGNGRQSRDFTYIDNVVKANLLACAKALLNGRVFNVGCGESHSVLGLVKILNSIMHKDIKPVFLKPRQGDVFKTRADIRAAQKDLSYRPKVNFTQGLKLTIEYFKNV